MPPVDHDAIGDDEDFARYVAAFREIEQPEPARRAASWAAIAHATAPAPLQRRSPWLWIGAVGTLLAAAWLLWSSDVLQLSFADAEHAQGRHDQAGYVPQDDAELEQARARTALPQRAPVVVAPVIVAPATEPPAPVVPPAAIKPRAAKPARVAPSLADETALFAEIQQALLAARPAAALASIAKHERDFPRGAFVQERIVAKAQALCAAGKPAAARKLRDRFVARNASSHLAPRMRAVCPE